MSHVEVPAGALEAADSVFGFDSEEERELVSGVLEAAAPHILIPELERLAAAVGECGGSVIRARLKELKNAAE